MKTTAGAQATQKRTMRQTIGRIPVRSTGSTARASGNTASGARFGRIMIATPAAAPAKAAERGVLRHARTSDAVQNVVAGTSLIGDIVMITTVGHVARHSDATIPMPSPVTRAPSA